MGKQKILIFVGILVLLLIAGTFYFLIKKDSTVEVKEEIPNTPLTQEEKEAKVFETLNSFKPPANPKPEAEVRKDLLSGPKIKNSKTEEEVKNDLLNITQ